MPSDVTGSSIYNQRTADFEFRPGPIFTNLLLADEINRAPPKTQAALLEAMQEHQVTSEGLTRRLERPFLVLATQNPIEHEGTYPLPEAQLDRFLLRISVGYPSREHELGILEQRRDRRVDEVVLDQVVDTAELREMQQALEDVYVAESLGYYIVDVVRATRDAASVQVGASPRGTLAILKLARARAVLDGRDFVVPDDVKAVAGPALAQPAVAQARALGSAGPRRGRRRGAAGDRADPAGGRPVTREASPRIAAYAVLGGLALVAALVTRRPELAALGAPFLLVLGVGLLTATDPELRASVALDRDRLIESDELRVKIELEATRPIARLEVLLELPPGLVVTDGDNPTAVRVAGPRTLSVGLRVERWGAYSIGDLTVRARDPARPVRAQRPDPGRPPDQGLPHQ
jgi:MoxR-like ATPase